MKNVSLITLLSWSACMIHPAQAQDYLGLVNLEKQTLKDASFTGPATLNSVTANSLTVTGELDFHDLIVKRGAEIVGSATGEKGIFGSLRVTGPLTGKEIKCTRLEVVGPAEVTDLKVSGETLIVGPLEATKSTFKNMTLTSEITSLTDVETGNILIKEGGKKKEVQTLQLKGKTHVKGTITFESGEGIVEKGKDVKVDGKITGGKIGK